jgi:hypothetical protein
MNAAEPGSTGTLKSAMTTGLPDATDCADATAEKHRKQLATNKKNTVTNKPKTTEARKRFLSNANKRTLFLAIKQGAYKLWHGRSSSGNSSLEEQQHGAAACGCCCSFCSSLNNPNFNSF